MRGNNVLGMIFANDDDGVLSDITGIRSMASVPFGGGYRLVDFVLSGFSKEDRIVPVITLCVCFDKKHWDGPRSLYDMFGKIDPRIKKYVNDYTLNLITPDEIEDFTRFSSELGIAMEFINISDDKKKLRGKVSGGHFAPRIRALSASGAGDN